MCRRRSAGVRAARLGVFCCRERPLGSRAAVSTFRGSVFGNGVHTGCLAEWRTWAIRASPSLPRQGTDMLINCMKVEGLLSFGREGIDLPMEPLNVLIGPNGSGKSNLLEVLALLQAAPRAFSEPINRGGGVQEWLWKGEEPPGRAYVEVEIAFPAAGALRHALTFVDRAGRPELVDERIEPATAPPAGDRAVFYCRPPRSEHAIARMRAAVPPPTIQEAGEAVGNVPPRNVAVEHAGGIQFAGDFRPEQSLLSFATPLHQALWFLSEQYGRIRLYRNWSFGPTAPLRRPASAHDPTDFLIEGGANLPLVLSNFHGSAKRRFVEALGELFDGIIDVSCPVTGGTVALFLEERDGRQIPASRLPMARCATSACLRSSCIRTRHRSSLSTSRIWAFTLTSWPRWRNSWLTPRSALRSWSPLTPGCFLMLSRTVPRASWSAKRRTGSPGSSGWTPADCGRGSKTTAWESCGARESLAAIAGERPSPHLHRGRREPRPQSRTPLPSLVDRVLQGGETAGTRSQNRAGRCTGTYVPAVQECAHQFRARRLAGATRRQRGASSPDSRGLAASAGARRLGPTSGCGRRSGVLDGAGNGDLVARRPPRATPILRFPVRRE